MVDSVRSFEFITHKTATLIKKIEMLASIHGAQLLNRQAFVKNQIKTMNESIYYNVDGILNGISKNKKSVFSTLGTMSRRSANIAKTEHTTSSVPLP